MRLKELISSSEELTKWLRYYAYHFTDARTNDTNSIIDYLRVHGLNDSDIMNRINQNYDLGKMRFALR